MFLLVSRTKTIIKVILLTLILVIFLKIGYSITSFDYKNGGDIEKLCPKFVNFSKYEIRKYIPDIFEYEIVPVYNSHKDFKNVYYLRIFGKKDLGPNTIFCMDGKDAVIEFEFYFNCSSGNLTKNGIKTCCMMGKPIFYPNTVTITCTDKNRKINYVSLSYYNEDALKEIRNIAELLKGWGYLCISKKEIIDTLSKYFDKEVLKNIRVDTVGELGTEKTARLVNIFKKDEIIYNGIKIPYTYNFAFRFYCKNGSKKIEYSKIEVSSFDICDILGLSEEECLNLFINKDALKEAIKYFYFSNSKFFKGVIRSAPLGEYSSKINYFVYENDVKNALKKIGISDNIIERLNIIIDPKIYLYKNRSSVFAIAFGNIPYKNYTIEYKAYLCIDIENKNVLWLDGEIYVEKHENEIIEECDLCYSLYREGILKYNKDCLRISNSKEKIAELADKYCSFEREILVSNVSKGKCISPKEAKEIIGRLGYNGLVYVGNRTTDKKYYVFYKKLGSNNICGSSGALIFGISCDGREIEKLYVFERSKCDEDKVIRNILKKVLGNGNINTRRLAEEESKKILMDLVGKNYFEQFFKLYATRSKESSLAGPIVQKDYYIIFDVNIPKFKNLEGSEDLKTISHVKCFSITNQNYAIGTEVLVEKGTNKKISETKNYLYKIPKDEVLRILKEKLDKEDYDIVRNFYEMDAVGLSYENILKNAKEGKIHKGSIIEKLEYLLPFVTNKDVCNIVELSGILEPIYPAFSAEDAKKILEKNGFKGYEFMGLCLETVNKTKVNNTLLEVKEPYYVFMKTMMHTVLFNPLTGEINAGRFEEELGFAKESKYPKSKKGIIDKRIIRMISSRYLIKSVNVIDYSKKSLRVKAMKKEKVLKLIPIGIPVDIRVEDNKIKEVKYPWWYSIIKYLVI